MMFRQVQLRMKSALILEKDPKVERIPCDGGKFFDKCFGANV